MKISLINFCMQNLWRAHLKILFRTLKTFEPALYKHLVHLNLSRPCGGASKTCDRHLVHLMSPIIKQSRQDKMDRYVHVTFTTFLHLTEWQIGPISVLNQIFLSVFEKKYCTEFREALFEVLESQSDAYKIAQDTFIIEALFGLKSRQWGQPYPLSRLGFTVSGPGSCLPQFWHVGINIMPTSQKQNPWHRLTTLQWLLAMKHQHS